MTFALHPTLAADCIEVGDLVICRALLMNNRHFPWLILVPRREGLREIYELSDVDYAYVMDEIRQTARIFSEITQAHKMNIAMLGNMVPQLHIHVISRFPQDAAWPKPVWNASLEPSPYPLESLENLVVQLRKRLIPR